MISVLQKTFKIIDENIVSFVELCFNFFLVGMLYFLMVMLTLERFIDIRTPIADVSVGSIMYASAVKGLIEIFFLFLLLGSIYCILDLAKGKKVKVPVFSKSQLKFMANMSFEHLISSLVPYVVYIILCYAFTILVFFIAKFFIYTGIFRFEYFIIINIAGFVLASLIFLKYLFVPMSVFDRCVFDEAFEESAELSIGNKALLFVFFVLFPVIACAIVLIVTFIYDKALVGWILGSILVTIMFLFMSVSYLKAKSDYVEIEEDETDKNEIPA